ncbi:hypothetical protein HY030_00450 [Candidatus Gottesmanbacteria bacterium]|nr:hypothetical protein [Candidatus Gottesmanbacteria bacterium]
MMEVKSVAPKSLFKVGFFFYLAMMLVVGLVGLVFLVFNLATNYSSAALTGALGAIAVYVGMALFYALVAAVFLGVSGVLYNKIAKRFGGIKVETEEIK